MSVGCRRCWLVDKAVSKNWSEGDAWGAEVAYLQISAQRRTACPPQYVVLAHITWHLSLIIEDYKSVTIASADCFDKNITTDCFDKIITLTNS